MAYEVLVLNQMAPVGLAQLNPQRYRLTEHWRRPDAILLRSFDLRAVDIPDTVQVVGRAGTGTNNIPVEKLTRLGVPVLNTPGANANAVKELVITGMLLASRNICAAWHYTQHLVGDDFALQQHIEQHKKQFAGFELPGKILGVVGLGKIGVKVANAARHLGMKVVGYDPAITVRNAWELSSSVQQADDLKDVLTRADFVTLHVPLSEKTHHFMNHETLRLMKPGAVLLNFARAEIVDHQALVEQLQQNYIRNYVCDFPSQLFKDNPKIICFPHLGASTKEAEENCAVMIAHQIQDYLESGQIRNAINFPTVKIPKSEGYRLAVINANIPNMVAQISSVLSSANMNIIDMINKSQDDIAYTLIDTNVEINDALLQKIRAIPGVIRARRCVEIPFTYENTHLPEETSNPHPTHAECE
ncbi:MAG: 3-phosphoglycerate dehydrogenase [Gammaproteobacteria bacterium RIFCSPHIGHO2_12_FULL_41_15]|nr:MAG: 3-phosphoglycerate dehydrogenase [Gammaproteobacteria bacterium RIFCSPHIGHO2_12_FULL_41_15]